MLRRRCAGNQGIGRFSWMNGWLRGGIGLGEGDFRVVLDTAGSVWTWLRVSWILSNYHEFVGPSSAV